VNYQADVRALQRVATRCATWHALHGPNSDSITKLGKDKTTSSRPHNRLRFRARLPVERAFVESLPQNVSVSRKAIQIEEVLCRQPLLHGRDQREERLTMGKVRPKALHDLHPDVASMELQQALGFVANRGDD
jgi:hypothetical protein